MAIALINRGITKGQRGDSNGAIADYTAVIALPNISTEQMAIALVNRGAAKSQQGDSVGAIADCTTAIALPDGPEDVLEIARRNLAGR